MEERLQEVIEFKRRVFGSLHQGVVALVGVLLVEQRLDAPKYFSRKSGNRHESQFCYRCDYTKRDSPENCANREK